MFSSLASLNVLEQLAKSVVSFSLQFDVGYFAGIHKICSVENDNIKTELKRLHKKGKSLWCNGLSPKSRASPVVCIDSDSNDEERPPVKKSKCKEKMPNVLESKARRVDFLANELGEKHGKRFTKNTVQTVGGGTG